MITLFKEIRFYLLVTILLVVLVPDNSDKNSIRAVQPFLPANYVWERYRAMETSLENFAVLSREENMELIRVLETLYARTGQPALQAAVVNINRKVKKNDIEILY